MVITTLFLTMLEHRPFKRCCSIVENGDLARVDSGQRVIFDDAGSQYRQFMR
jgi:hypothetical protein